MFKKVLPYLVFINVALLTFYLGWWMRGTDILKKDDSRPLTKVIPRPFEKYTIANIASSSQKGALVTKEKLEEKDTFTTNLIEFTFRPDPESSETKKTTGALNIPQKEGKLPLVVMFRGYIDPSVYTTGSGTKRAAEVFARNGFATVSLDFLGYAGSDSQSENIFEARFQTYVAALSLLNSLDQIEKWDGENVFIWGHSNGGQISLTVLEASGVDYPTTLWAPVTKPFPYSVLYYTDDSDDRGKLIRKELAKFEELYDVDQYAVDLYLERIKAPIQLHQGTADDLVPQEWSDEIVKGLKNADVQIDYYKYPGADHNLQPGWSTVVARDLDFFRRHVK